MDVEKCFDDLIAGKSSNLQNVSRNEFGMNEDSPVTYQGPITRSRAKNLQLTLPSISHSSHDENVTKNSKKI